MLLYLLVGILSLSIIGLYAYYKAKKALISRATEQLNSVRTFKKTQIENFFQENRKLMFAFSENRDLFNSILKSEQDNELLTMNIKKTIIDFFDIQQVISLKVDTLTNLIYFTKDSLINDFSIKKFEHQLLKNAKSENIKYIEVTSDSISSKLFITRMIADSASNTKLIFVLDIPSDEIDQMMLDTNYTNGLGKSGEIYLVGDDYNLKSKSRFYSKLAQPIKSETQSVINALNVGSGSAVFNDYRNIRCLCSFDRLAIDGLNWAIIAEIDYAEAIIPITDLRNDLIFVSIIILILIFSIGQVITTDIIVPIVKLKNSAIKIGTGNFEEKVDIQSENEFGVLASTFNQMIESIKKNTSELIDERTARISALYDGQEFERHRISRELHDGLAQQLIAIKMALENITFKKEFFNDFKINELKSQINSSIDELRKISHDLAPAGLMEFTIEIALENLCIQTQNNTSINIDFSAYGDFSNLNQQYKIYLYRIVQEALNNTIKHAEATQIQIHLSETNTYLLLIIEDNGKGFDFDSKNLGLGKGLFNMRERSILLNGSFDIETFPNKGTTIRVKVNKLK
jgi:signal transduction histidine kinase